MSPVSPESRPDAARLRQHLERLYPLIREGIRQGWHMELRHLRRAEVQALLDMTAPRYSADETHAAFEVAGEAVVFGALVLAYTQRVELLTALGEDTSTDRARLQQCLAHRGATQASGAVRDGNPDRVLE